MTSSYALRAVSDLQPGDHLCCLYETEEEHRALLTPYLRQGIERGEKVVYIVDARTAETVLGYLRDDGMEVENYLASGQLLILTANDAYLREGVFSPEGMISLLRAETERALEDGYTAFRATGEMTWALQGLPGSERLMEYEAKLNDFFHDSKAIGLCQYDRRRFDAAALLDVLSTHPIAVVGTEIYDNFYYVPPSEFLGHDRPATTLRHRLESLREHARLYSAERSARREAEAARQQVSGILESITDAFFALDRQWRITYVNKAAEPLLRKAREDLLGKNLWDEFPEAVGSTFYNEYHRVLLEQVPTQFEEYYPPFDAWFEVHAYPRADGVAVYFQDISARRRIEEDLRKLSRAVEQSASSVLITDIWGHIEYANPKFVQTTGYTLDEAIGKNPRILKSGETLPEGYKELWETITSGREWRGEFHNKKKNGELYWEFASISPIRDPAGNITHYLAVKEDITERKHVEEDRERLLGEVQRRATELNAVNKELEAFSYSVSHDLRAPLRSIDGFSRVLIQSYGDKLDEKGKDYLERVRAASQRMGQLIDDLLMLSRVTRKEMRREPVDLSLMARDIAREIMAADKERQVEFQITPHLVGKGDPELLRLVLGNLLWNAWKFTSTRPSATIEFGVAEEGGKLAYFVKDDGAGFDMAYAHKLFGAFQRLHGVAEFPGSGIGLATVQRIIRRHGGRVWAEGAVGKGATFYFTL